jgi:aminodeoxyfutalosine deaminase
VDSFVDELPKAELHLHLVGSASVPTVLELARRHPAGNGIPRTEPELRAFFEFRDFPHFAEVYGAVSALVREHGVRIGYIFDVASEYGAEAARATLDHALSCPPEALTGFGLAGIEQSRPAHQDVFRDVFAAAIAAGLHSVPHAGEMSGPPTIWEAVNGLRAERIGHGISCLADPSLVAYLRETQIPLEVCPTSNVCTRQVPALAAHPLPRLLAEGLFVTLNSDDPPMFGTTLTQEYRRAASVLGLSRDQLADLARNSVRASFLDAGAKQALIDEIDHVAAGHV